jgi:hypothetical protein
LSSGILIVDNNCPRHLRRPQALARIIANQRVADLVVFATEVNLLEVAAASPDELQADLVRILRTIAAAETLLPWPFALLKSIGAALARGVLSYRAPPSGKEWYLDDPVALRELRDEVLAFNVSIEEAFNALHETNRRRLHIELKRRGAREDFADTRDFLERQWYGSDLRRIYAEVTWRAFGLPDPVPMDLLEANQAWRLLLDVEGVAVYERAVALEQPPRVHRRDLIQLVYLGGSSRRVLTTADNGLLRAGNAVLHRRYANARVVHIGELVA